MQTRRDQLHAYRFMTRRAMSSLVTGEPDAIEPPMRRLTTMTISGVMVAIVVAAVFAVVGLLRGGGGDQWREEGSVVVEEETGARYVNIGGTLYPALNYSSAVLASGAADAVELQGVSRSDLSAAERGYLIGIPGLPDSMPDAEDLVRGPVSVCSQPQTEGIETLAEVVVAIGPARSEAVPGTDGLYVESFDGDRFLLLGGERLPVARGVEAALQVSETPVPVGSALLTAIPMGPALDTPSLPDQGSPVDVGGRRLLVGQVIEVDDGTFRVVLSDGLARVSDVQAKLLQTAELAGQRREPVPMSLSDVLGLDEGAGLGDVMAGLPEVMPTLVSQSSAAVCAVFSEGEDLPQLAIPSDVDPGTPTGESATSRAGSADRVELEPGQAMLAASPDAKAVYLVGAPGRLYAASSLATLAGFGFGSVEPVMIPAELVAILPQGPAMDPVKAREAAG